MAVTKAQYVDFIASGQSAAWFAANHVTPAEITAFVQRQNTDLKTGYETRTPAQLQSYVNEMTTLRTKYGRSYADPSTLKGSDAKTLEDNARMGELRYLLDGPQEDTWVAKYGKYVAIAAVAAAGAGMVLAGSAAIGATAAAAATGTGATAAALPVGATVLTAAQESALIASGWSGAQVAAASAAAASGLSVGESALLSAADASLKAAGAGSIGVGTISIGGVASSVVSGAKYLLNDISLKDVGTIISAGGTIVDAVGNVLAGEEAAKTAKINAERSSAEAYRTAASIEEAGAFNVGQLTKQAANYEMTALDAVYRGTDQYSKERQKGIEANATGRTIQASSGTSTGTGNNLAVEAKNTRVASLNALTVLNNAEREAFGYTVDADQAKAQAFQLDKTTKAEATNLRESADLGIADAATTSASLQRAGYISAAGNAARSITDLYRKT